MARPRWNKKTSIVLSHHPPDLEDPTGITVRALRSRHVGRHCATGTGQDRVILHACLMLMHPPTITLVDDIFRASNRGESLQLPLHSDLSQNFGFSSGVNEVFGILGYAARHLLNKQYNGIP